MDRHSSMTEMSAAVKYTLDDISTIIFNGFEYELDPKVLSIVQKLAEQVGAADYVRTPQFQKNNNMSRGRRGKSRGTQEISDQDWEAIRHFQATELAKKEGVEASIDKIRVYLNKITDSTFDTQKQAIFSEIQGIVSSGASDDETAANLRRISESLFAIASNNSFYSSLYAELYKVLLKEYDFLGDTIEAHLLQAEKLFDNIEWCEPQKDYDRFCEINKANDSRRAVALFFVNLMKRDLVSKERIAELVVKLQKDLKNEMTTEERTPVVEELAELLNVLITNMWTPDSCLDATERQNWLSHWNEQCSVIRHNVDEIASTKAKSHPSLSNKTVFKHMDIRDALNKLDKQ